MNRLRYLINSTYPFQLYIKKIKPIFLNHGINKIRTIPPQLIQQYPTFSHLIPIIIKINNIFHFPIFKHTIHPTILLYIEQASFTMKYIITEISFIDIIVFEYSHPVSLDHVVFVLAFLDQFQLELIFVLVCLRIVTAFLWNSVDQLEAQALGEALAGVLHVVYLDFVAQFQHSDMRDLLGCQFVFDDFCVIFANQQMISLSQQEILDTKFVNRNQFTLSLKTALKILKIIDSPLNKINNKSITIDPSLLIIPEIQQIPINPVHNIMNSITNPMNRNKCTIPIKNTITM